MTEPIFISSLVAHVSSENLTDIMTAIEAMPCAEIPLHDDTGKLVVLLDAADMKELVATTDKIRGLPGIYSVQPVYQHDESGAKAPFTNKN